MTAPAPRRPLYRQFITQLLLPLTLAFLLAGSGLVFISHQVQQSKQATQRQEIMTVFAHALVKPLWDCDSATTQGILNTLAYLSAVRQARLDEPCQKQQLQASDTGKGASTSTQDIYLEHAIVHHDEQGREYPVGTLGVHFQPPSIGAAVTELLGPYLLLFLILLAVMTGGALLVFRRIITQPLAHFLAAIRTGINGGSGSPALSEAIQRHNDELGEVMQAYDQLMQDLARVIDKLRQNEKTLLESARRDPLTGLGNRLVLEEALDQALRRSHRTQEPGCVLLIDLNRFKPINDTYGHAAGDQVLQVTAQRLMAHVRRTDTVIRLGGDEFVIIIEQLSQPPDPQPLMDKLCDIIAQPVEFAGHTLSVGASIGAACFLQDGDNSQTLLAHADQAMYAQKPRGR